MIESRFFEPPRVTEHVSGNLVDKSSNSKKIIDLFKNGTSFNFLLFSNLSSKNLNSLFCLLDSYNEISRDHQRLKPTLVCMKIKNKIIFFLELI